LDQSNAILASAGCRRPRAIARGQQYAGSLANICSSSSWQSFGLVAGPRGCGRMIDRAIRDRFARQFLLANRLPTKTN
jgi:hypothetical protein